MTLVLAWEVMRRKLSLVSRAWKQVTNREREIDVNIEEWSFMSLIASLSEEFQFERMRKEKMAVGSPWGMACLAASMASKLQGSTAIPRQISVAVLCLLG